MQKTRPFWFLLDFYAWVVLILSIVTAFLVHEWWVVLLGLIGYLLALIVDLAGGRALGRTGAMRLARAEPSADREGSPSPLRGEGRGEGMLSCLTARAAEQLCLEARYEGYIRRAFSQVRQIERQAAMRIPDGFDYAAIEGIRFEAREKLAKIRPETLGQASRLPGVSPADLALLAVRIAQGRGRRSL